MARDSRPNREAVAAPLLELRPTEEEHELARGARGCGSHECWWTAAFGGLFTPGLSPHNQPMYHPSTPHSRQIEQKTSSFLATDHRRSVTSLTAPTPMHFTPTPSDWAERLRLQGEEPPDYFSSREQILHHASEVKAHQLLEAWDKLELVGVVCTEGKPQVFIKKLMPGGDSLATIERLFWNNAEAPILVAIDNEGIRVFSSLCLPGLNASAKHESAIVETLRWLSNADDVTRLITRIRCGEYFENHKQFFDPDKRVDRTLLRNIIAAVNILTESSSSIPIASAEAILGRCLYLSYLFDKGLLSQQYLTEAGLPNHRSLAGLLEADDAPDQLSNLLARVQATLGGDLRIGAVNSDSEYLNESVVATLLRLFRGDNVESPQHTLGLYPYDFSQIALGTVGAVYESFLKIESESDKENYGAYYTPHNLADLVVQKAFQYTKLTHSPQILDPACGSGVFLVSAFRILAYLSEQQTGKLSSEERFFELSRILTTQIKGFDKNQTACRLTAISLNLALLNRFTADELHELFAAGYRLPRLFAGASDAGSAICCADFLAEAYWEQVGTFDIVICNPPWVSEQNVDRKILEIESAETANYQVANDFLILSLKYLKSSGAATFIVPSSLFFNAGHRALAFRRSFVSRAGLKEIINLSDFRHFLFEDAKRPACVICFDKSVPASRSGVIHYSVPKCEPEAVRTEQYQAYAIDRHVLPWDFVLRPNSDFGVILKILMWGSGRDLRLIEKLSSFQSLSDLAGPPGQGTRWVTGVGFKPARPKMKSKPIERESWSDERLFLKAEPRSFSGFLVNVGRLDQIGDTFRFLERRRDDSIFDAPLVAFTSGFTCFGFSSEPLWFRHSIQSIHGSWSDVKLLRLLAVYLASPLAKYYMFHTSGSMGTERGRVLQKEVLRLPFPLPGDIVDEGLANEILLEVSNVVENAEVSLKLGVAVDFDDLQRTLNPFVYQYFGLDDWEQALVHDGVCVAQPSATPTSRDAHLVTCEEVSITDRNTYLGELLRMLNLWLTRKKRYVTGYVLCDEESGVGFIVIDRLGRSHSKERTMTRALLDDAGGLDLEVLRSVLFRQSFRLILEDCIVIAKPLRRRWWTKSRAQADADDLAIDLLSSVSAGMGL